MKIQRLTLLPFLCTLLLACQSETLEQNQTVRPVKTEIIQNSDGFLPVAYSGLVKAASNTNLSFRVGGTLSERPITVGQTLKMGDLVAQLDKTDLQLEEAKATGAVGQAQAEMNKAHSKLKRIRQLAETGNVSPTEYDDAKGVYESARSILQQNKTNLNIAQQSLSYTTLTAPTDDCIVVTIDIQVNEAVSAGKSIVQLNCSRAMEVKVAIPETIIGSIQASDVVKVHVNALTGKTLQGLVTEVGVESEGATFPVTVQLTEVDEQLRSGMAATVIFSVKQHNQSGIYVPSNAIASDRDGFYVFIYAQNTDASRQEMAKQGVAKKRRIQVGSLSLQGVAVLHGLNVGERLITAGVHHLHDGQIIRLMSQ